MAKYSTFLQSFIFIIVFIEIACVPRVIEAECEVFEANVTHIFEAGEKDICFKIKGVKSVFYINRGLESGLDFQT